MVFNDRFIRRRALIAWASVPFIMFAALPLAQPGQQAWSPVDIPGPDEHPAELIQLTEEFRTILGWGSGVPDYAGTVGRQKEKLPEFRARLEALDTSDWSVHEKIDYLLLRSEMDRLEFDLHVWRQTSRNPSFYVAQAIRNVGRHLTGGRRMYVPELMPYTKERAQTILQALADTPKFVAQGRRNLTEMVPALADMALRNPGNSIDTDDLDKIVVNYRKWAEVTAEHFPEPEASQLVSAAEEAARHLLEFGNWLKENRDDMPGKYYISEEAIDWYHRHVSLIPYTTDELRLMAEMERARSLSYLQFEMHKNRNLPKIGPAETIDKYTAWDDETELIIRRWYTESGQDILSDREYMLNKDVRVEEAVLLPPFGRLAFPYQEKPDTWRILVVSDDHWRAKYSNMGFRTDPGVLSAHEWWPGHTYEGEVHRHNPCPIRRGHRDGAHSQGWCFYLAEELLVAMDFPFVRGPRARELPYINMLQRAERVSMGLDLLTGQITPEEAYIAFRKNVPLLGSGLGASEFEALEEMGGVLVRGLDHCQTGKLQIFKLLADRKMQLKENFDLKEFHDQVISLGSVPISLLRWEIARLDDEVKELWEPVRLASVLQTLAGTDGGESQ